MAKSKPTKSVPVNKICCATNCDEPASARDRCRRHYKQHYQTLSDWCAADGCDRGSIARKLCSLHYSHWQKANGPRCQVDGCKSGVNGYGLCSRHYQWWRKSTKPGFSGVQPHVQPSVSLADRFWMRVKKTDSCWLWTGGTKPNGYPYVTFENRKIYAHRVSWFLHHGYHSKLLICHTCDVRTCVNPSHLFEGTHKDNFDDMVSKGRGFWQKGKSK